MFLAYSLHVSLRVFVRCPFVFGCSLHVFCMLPTKSPRAFLSVFFVLSVACSLHVCDVSSVCYPGVLFESSMSSQRAFYAFFCVFWLCVYFVLALRVRFRIPRHVSCALSPFFFAFAPRVFSEVSAFAQGVFFGSLGSTVRRLPISVARCVRAAYSAHSLGGVQSCGLRLCSLWKSKCCVCACVCVRVYVCFFVARAHV